MPSEEDDAVSTYPTICATQARSLLRRAVPISVDGSNDLGMSASAAAVRICEQATSDAPSKCLADTQHNRALSTKLRVQLCQRATSNSPQLCVRSLRKFVHVRRMGIDDAVMICRQTESPGPAECAAELFRATAFVTGKIAAQLCHATKTLEPARCFVDSPTFFDDELKVLLCNQAESSAPASCAAYMISRFTNQPSMKVSLCRGATSAAPAACAIEAPFGMDETSVVELCRSAESIAPASGFSAPNHLLYALPRPLYELFTMDMPRAEMSAWALLGLKEGESSRAVIRRAYHQRSLQWHPDKWHALAAALPPVWQQELVGIYALITQAYDQLTR
ncbi:hypothetical protein PC118_g223 [Phytophthora cactorum]|uniref:J domain-containing protein n=1 Tax=Phytophthora cactorum TaxID=29920 RepID=A0A8T1GSU6_9STRA|nr:hypothetical protein PC118_g223 [Phytophthora cactorum]